MVILLQNEYGVNISMKNKITFWREQMKRKIQDLGPDLERYINGFDKDVHRLKMKEVLNNINETYRRFHYNLRDTKNWIYICNEPVRKSQRYDSRWCTHDFNRTYCHANGAGGCYKITHKRYISVEWLWDYGLCCKSGQPYVELPPYNE